jgi:hypothetical protein
MKKIKKKIELKKETITRLNTFQLNSILGGIDDVKKTGVTRGVGPYYPTCGSGGSQDNTCESCGC